MKMLFCTNVQLGINCAENMEIKYMHKWKTARTEQFAELYDKAIREHASYIALFGDLFGQERVSESLIDSFFQAVSSEASVQTLAFLDLKEYTRIVYRKDIPTNLHLLCIEKTEQYTDKNIAARITQKGADFKLRKKDVVSVEKTPNGSWHMIGIKNAGELLSFEPTGFEEIERKYGYSFVEWEQDGALKYEEVCEQHFQYETEILKIAPEDTAKDILQKATTLVRNMKPDTILRLEVRGRAAFALPIPLTQIREKLESRIFFAKVFDNTIMDVNEAEFENDISLRSEFVRLALRDESLSETERNRLIRCGWSALSGKEAAVE